jgi:HD-GYP domain-containing protein (c-di-GMP phosphodiesterase class II)/DNA-binding CsgD family transcriptional regulator
MGVSEEDLIEVYYVALLRFVGCTADAHESAVFAGGDEIRFNAGIGPHFMGETPEVLGYLIRHLAEGRPLLQRARLVASALTDMQGTERSLTAHCEVAQMLVGRMGLSDRIHDALGHAYERWDGKGYPGGLAGEAIPISVRIAIAARDVEILHRLGGQGLVTDVVRRRKGKAYDPTVAEALLAHAEQRFVEMERESSWEAVLNEEPGPQSFVTKPQLDGILMAFAEFADLKSPFTYGHSTAVASLAETAARQVGLGESEVIALRRAGLLHDLGRTGIANGVWDKPGPLTLEQWERVRLHPYFTERILARCSGLARIAALAGSHHERLDGSGYHRGIGGSLLSDSARILAAADAYQAMTQDRPHRKALPLAIAAKELAQQAAAGKLDAEAVNAVLSASGAGEIRSRRAWPAGLTDREVEVLGLLCKGSSNPEIARQLSITRKTVAHHVEHIYGKIGVSTRAGAALFAMRNKLIHDQP